MLRPSPALLLLTALLSGHDLSVGPHVGPRYAPDGALILPAGIERWVLVGTSTGLSYGAGDPTTGPGAFHAVHLEPSAYATWRAEGRFPDGTMLALVIRPPARPGPPGRDGWVAGGPAVVELAVKDTSRFPGGWAYYDFGPGVPGARARPFPPAQCARCHAAHAAEDNVFVQFYPVLRETRATDLGPAATRRR